MRSELGLLVAASCAIPLGLLLLSDEGAPDPPSLQQSLPPLRSQARQAPPPHSAPREAPPSSANTQPDAQIPGLPVRDATPGAEPLVAESGGVAVSVQDIDGFPLEATVWEFDPTCPEEGKPLAHGRGKFMVPGSHGMLVRITASKRVPIVTPLIEGGVVLQRGRTLEGEVVAEESGARIIDALVESPSAHGVSIARTDRFGRFQLVVPEAPADLFVLAAGRPAVKWTADSASPLVRLPLGRGARGIVVRDDGTPVADVDVLVVGSRQLSRSFRARSDSGGRFSLPSGLHSDEQVVLVAGSIDWKSSRDPVWQAALDDLKVVVSPPSQVLIDGEGELVPEHTWPGEAPLAAPESAGGKRNYSGLASGGYRVVIEGRLVANLRVGRGASTTFVTPVEQAEGDSRFIVRVVDENGRGIVGAEVRVQGDLSDARATSGAGGVATLALPLKDPGETLVLSGSAPGRIHRPGLVDPSSPETELVFTRAASLVVTLSPPLAAEVAVYANGVAIYRGRTGVSGLLHISALPAGSLAVVVEAPSGQLVKHSVTLPLSRPLRVRLQD